MGSCREAGSVARVLSGQAQEARSRFKSWLCTFYMCGLGPASLPFWASVALLQIGDHIGLIMRTK